MLENVERPKVVSSHADPRRDLVVQLAHGRVIAMRREGSGPPHDPSLRFELEDLGEGVTHFDAGGDDFVELGGTALSQVFTRER